jgi:hypothetical protein
MLGDNRDGTCEVGLGEVDYLVGFHTEDDESSAEHSTSTSEEWETVPTRATGGASLVSGGGQRRSAYTVVRGRSQSTFSGSPRFALTSRKFD